MPTITSDNGAVIGVTDGEGNTLAFAYTSTVDGENVTGWHNTIEDATDVLIDMYGFNPFLREYFDDYGSRYMLQIEHAANLGR